VADGLEVVGSPAWWRAKVRMAVSRLLDPPAPDDSTHATAIRHDAINDLAELGGMWVIDLVTNISEIAAELRRIREHLEAREVDG
jgi:hypothetical protein